MEDDFGKGEHEITVDLLMLEVVGLLYYQLETKDYVATRRMLVLD